MSRRANELMLQIKEALKLELPSFSFTDGVVSGNPTLLVSADATPAAGEAVAYLKMIQKSYVGFPSPSLASSDDGRTHTLQLVLELSAVAGVSVWSSINFAKLMARLQESNVHIELYLRANGGIPVEADIVSGNLVGEIRSDVRHPNAGN